MLFFLKVIVFNVCGIIIFAVIVSGNPQLWGFHNSRSKLNWGDLNLNIGYIDGETPPPARASNNLEFCQHIFGTWKSEFGRLFRWILPMDWQPNAANFGISSWWADWIMVPSIWVFPKIGVPQNGWFIIKHPIKMDVLGVPLFLETPILPETWWKTSSQCQWWISVYRK